MRNNKGINEENEPFESFEEISEYIRELMEEFRLHPTDQISALMEKLNEAARLAKEWRERKVN